VATHRALRHWFDIRPEELRGEAQVVSPYCEIESHPLIVAAGVARPDGALQPFVHPKRTEAPPDREPTLYERVRISLEPWFDPWTGSFGRGAIQAASELPLYHDVIAVRFPRMLQAEPALAVGWGLDAEQAGLRAIRNAVALLVGAGAPSRGTVVAELSLEAWQGKARALALMSESRGRELHRCASVDLEAVEDPAVRVLLRMLRFHTSARVRVLMHWLPGQEAYAAQCWVAEELLGAACDSSASAAMQEAVGQVCSAYQLASSVGIHYWRDRAPAIVAPEAPSWADWPPPAVPAAEPRPASFHLSSSWGWPDGIFCGHALV
jgi:hypothetical protein